MAATSVIQSWLVKAGADKIRITKDGTEILCTCPFHQSRRGRVTFSFNTTKGLYTCFVPSCGASGSVVTFLQRAFGFSLEKAKRSVKNLTFEEGVNLEEVQLLGDYRDRRKQETSTKTTITEGELGMFDFCPKYMLRRGYTKETLKKWEIGFDAEDRRVVFPVRDRSGKLLGTSGRAIDKHVEPRYLHAGFDKSNVLYGEHFCRNVTGVVVVEGQTDALAIDQRARKILKRMNLGVVGVLGANVPDAQVAKLSRYNKVILAFDNDEAGQSAIASVGKRLNEKIPRGHLLVAHRFTCHDPGELISASDIELEQFFDTTPYIEFITHRTLRESKHARTK